MTPETNLMHSCT